MAPVVAASLLVPGLLDAATPPGFTPLFNGKDLGGWHISQLNHHGTSRGWSVENGIVLGTQDRPGNGGILLSDRVYRDFEVSLEIKPDWGCDGGLFLRSNERGQAYQVMIDYLEGGSVGGIYGERLTGVEGGSGERVSRDWSKHWRKDEWNTLRARIEGEVPRIRVWLNDAPLVDWRDSANHAAGGATEGMIALQVHYSNEATPRWSEGGFHRYRNVAVRELPRLSLGDFAPRSMLEVPVHEVERAAFPAVDVHNHVNDARGRDQPVPIPELVARMERLNLKRLVILTGRWGDALQGVVERMVKPYPGRFTVFTEPDWARIDEPGFGDAMAAQIRDAVARGARGLKILKNLGLGVRDGRGALVSVDDPRLDPMWAECGRLGIPVAIHTADPDAFFEPFDARNERWEELLRRPEWSFHGPGFPTKRALLDARNRVFARHPGTSFIALHVANHPEDLDDAASVLDRYPNVVVETGARQAELGRQPRRAREFFLRYQDRVLFGTDATPSDGLYRSWFRFLETADEHFDYWNAPAQGRWKISGLQLPKDVLEKVYARNAERVIPDRSPSGASARRP